MAVAAAGVHAWHQISPQGDRCAAERQLGRRSLLELLSAELSLIGALGDLTSTEADAAIASLTLLQAVGRLNLGSFEMKPVDAVLPKL